VLGTSFVEELLRVLTRGGKFPGQVTEKFDDQSDVICAKGKQNLSGMEDVERNTEVKYDKTAECAPK